MRKFLMVSAIFASLAIPSVAHAQAAIAGVVKDSSGAVLPGVTVEAASPALIEKVRSVVTDGTGQYKIVDLRAGVYTVTFTLTGFNTIQRAGIELSGNFSATVNADMKVGAIEETITVTGETPIVDIQSARQQSIINKDVLDSIPTGRSHNQIVSLIPGVTVAGNDVGGSGGIQTPGAGQIHGSGSGDGRLQSDGLNVGYNGGSANMWMSNAAAAQETVVSTSGGLGEAETGGVVVNIVPRDGGNTFKGTVFANYAGESWAANNFTGDLKTNFPNLKVNTIQKVYDFNPMFGGPIVKDRLWFFATSRTVGANNFVAGMTHNLNVGAICNTPTSCSTPNFDNNQAVTDNKYVTGTLRLTAQATSKNKFAAYYDQQDRCVTCTGGGTATTTIEATARSHAVPSAVGQLTWQSPLTSRLLLEAGYGFYNQRWGGRPRDDGTYNPSLTNITDQAGVIPGLSYRQPGNYQHNWTGQQNWRASASYVTGANSMKIGYYGAYDQPTTNTDNYTGFSNFQMSNGTLNRMTQFLSVNWATLMKVTSLYAQDQWTHGRMTLQGGVRFDKGVTEFTGGDRASLPTIRAGIWLASPITFSGNDLKGTDYKDITPRGALSYDLFGDGKTAVKVVMGKYMQALNGSTNLNPIARAATTATRSWTDSNHDLIPQCNFASTGATNLNAANKIIDPSIDACGPISNPAFATSLLNSTFNYAEFSGWGNRPYEWDFSTSVQREILPRVSLTVGYFRRWFGNQSITDNAALTAADFDSFSVVAPVDPRLPGGGGYTVSGLYNVKPDKFQSIDNRITLASNYGNFIQHWNGFDVTVNGRIKTVTFQGGTSTGRDSWDVCEIRAKVPELTVGGGILPFNVSPTSPYCSGETKFLTQFKGLASYVFPKIDVNLSATFQSIPNTAFSGLGVGNPGLAANQNVTSAQTDLGRAFAGGAANLSVNLIQPGTVYGDRTNQIDLRVAKILRYGRTRTQVGLDLYNLTNSNAVQTYNQTYIPNGAWLTPTSILQSRFVKLSAQFDW